MAEQAWVWVLAAGLALLLPLLVAGRTPEAEPTPVEVPAEDEPHRS
ncbi:MAG: hypothetical protein K6U89_06790 [Chloroflexi bacterium]|nr:hypothetical protein [Chloroflexota bacterium]GIW11580.1 MAG: hypothetical protein KatS3mg061_2637 [Dehalococcoidia bacterium]